MTLDYLATKIASQANPDAVLVDLADLLMNIIDNAEMAELNATTISDNNDTRILL